MGLFPYFYSVIPYPWMPTFYTSTHARPHTNTVNMLTYCTHTHHSTYQSLSFLLPSSCVFFLPSFSLQRSALCTINVRHVIHKSKETHKSTHTHKVARLVGATAAALLRSPRVAPGARLPVVCQRLRVEFIQIKAVEWGPSPRMPRPSPSSAFRRWE